MKLACCFLLFLFTILQSNCLGLRLASYHNEREYTLTCSTTECQAAISFCYTKCIGMDQCKKCLHSFPECSSTCASYLFNQDDHVNVNGVKYFPCDDSSPEQVNACELHCSLLDGFPMCQCSSLPPSTAPTQHSVLVIALQCQL
jgi:hypothetical protein